MLSKRIRLLSALLVLAVCALPVMASGQEDLIDVDQQIQQEITYTTTEVRRGSFTKEATSPAMVHYPLYWNVAATQNGTHFAEYVVSEGAAVKAGDPLVRLSQAADEIALARLEKELSRMKEEFKAAVAQKEEEISAAKQAMDAQNDVYEKEKQSIAIQILQTKLDQFGYHQQRSIDAKQAEVNAHKSRFQPLVLTAPADGVVMALASKNPGDSVSAGEVLVALVRTDVRLLKVNNSALELRYQMPVTVAVGRGDNQTFLTGRVIAADDAVPEGQRSGFAYILLNPGSEDVELRDVKVTGCTVKLDNVLLVERSAVKQEDGKPYVTKLTDDMVQRRGIIFGMSNVSDSWILVGVAEGETLILD